MAEVDYKTFLFSSVINEEKNDSSMKGLCGSLPRIATCIGNRIMSIIDAQQRSHSLSLMRIKNTEILGEIHTRLMNSKLVA